MQGKLLYANDAVRRKLGFSPEELRSMAILDLHPEDRREEAGEILGAMIRKEKTNCPLQLRRKDGGELPVDTRVWFGQWDGQECIFGISKDLGAEQEALQKFSKLFDGNPALMAITETQSGRFTEVNESFLEKLGYWRAEVVGKTSAELDLFVDPVKGQRVRDELAASGRIRSVELEVRRKDGRVLDGLFSGEIIDVQGTRHFLTVMVDISEQVELRRRLEVERRRLHNIIDGTSLGTWEWNVQTGATVFNERWAGIAGYTLAELEPTGIATWERLAHPDDLAESARLLERHFAGESAFYECECRMRHKDGHWIWVLDRGKVIERDAGGRPLMMFGTHADITDKKELADRIRELSIRDPLTGIYNRRYVLERLEEVAAERSRRGRSFCVSILDIDHFKAVNDRHGHQAGDAVLRDFSALLASSIRPYDLLGRYGGEEFIVVSIGATARDTVRMLERILEAARDSAYAHDGAEIRFTFSGGVAEAPETESPSVEATIQAADRRLYAAKEGGRNRIVGPDAGAA